MMKKSLIILIISLILLAAHITYALDITAYGGRDERNRRYLVGYQEMFHWLVTSVYIGNVYPGDVIQIFASAEIANEESTTVGVSGNISMGIKPWPYDYFQDSTYIYGLSPGNLSQNFAARINPHYMSIIVPYSFEVVDPMYDLYLYFWIAIGTDDPFYNPDSDVSTSGWYRHLEIKRSAFNVLVFRSE